MAKRRRPPSQGWRTFVHNHADAITSIDMFVVPTISFGLLYGLLILRQSRRELLWLGVTAHPNAEWLARQLTAACGWDEPPCYLIRDRDGAYGAAFIRRIRAMGIRDRPVPARSLIGSIRRECLDHVVVVGERHLLHVLASYQKYHNEVRTHLSLQKAAPVRRDVCQPGCVRRRSWAGYTINMFEFEFPTGTRVDPTSLRQHGAARHCLESATVRLEGWLRVQASDSAKQCAPGREPPLIQLTALP